MKYFWYSLETLGDNRDFGSPDAVVIHVGTNDMKRTVNLDYVTGSDKYGKDEVLSIQGSAKWCVTEERRVMAAQGSNKRQTRMGSEYTRSDFRRPKLFDGRLELSQTEPSYAVT
jgi:hypothetical protein